MDDCTVLSGRTFGEAEQAGFVEVCRWRNTDVKYNHVYTVTRHKTSNFHAMDITSASIATSLFCDIAVAKPTIVPSFPNSY